MTAPTKADTASEIAPWYAISADEVVKRLATKMEKGLDAAEASTRLQKYGPNRLPEGKKRGRSCASRAVQQHPGLCSAWRRLRQADGGSVARCRDHSGCGHHQWAARVHPGGQGGEGAGFDPQHALGGGRTVRGGETRMVPAEELVPGDIVLLESGDKIPADFAWWTSKNLRTEEAALTGESVPIDKSHGRGVREGDGRRPGRHGVLRNVGRIRARNRRRRCDGQRDGTWVASTS